MNYSLLKNKKGGGPTIVLVVIISSVFLSLIGTYQSSIRQFQKRHFQLKETQRLMSITESLAVLVRSSYDVAQLAPRVAGVPQCPQPTGGTAPAQAHCFKSNNCPAVAEKTYFCWPDMSNANSKCVEGDFGELYCFGENSTGGGRNDILPVQVRHTSTPNDEYVAENTFGEHQTNELFHWHWSDVFNPLSNFLASDFELDTSRIIMEKAFANTIVKHQGNQPARMTTMNCVGNNDFCKSCTAENGCIQIAVCPKFRTVAECQNNSGLRFTQRMLFTF